MGLSADEIADHSALHGCLRQQSRSLLQIYEASPRMAAIFATQQRWLMAHAGLALYFRRDPSDSRDGLTAARFLEVNREYGVASRNTAAAFVQEMLTYDFARYAPGGKDGRMRALEPAQSSLDALSGWLMIHLSTLDALDGGHRLKIFHRVADPLARIQPLIAEGLLSSAAVRKPAPTFSLFTWLNNGGIAMDWLIAGTQDAEAGAERIPTGIVSTAEFARGLKLSRTHLARKLREAEELGSVGWQGQRGKSVMWVSKAFEREYSSAQAVKLAIIDAAFETCFPPA
jgi:hypothetical protein